MFTLYGSIYTSTTLTYVRMYVGTQCSVCMYVLFRLPIQSIVSHLTLPTSDLCTCMDGLSTQVVSVQMDSVCKWTLYKQSLCTGGFMYVRKSNLYTGGLCIQLVSVMF